MKQRGREKGNTEKKKSKRTRCQAENELLMEKS